LNRFLSRYKVKTSTRAINQCRNRTSVNDSAAMMTEVRFSNKINSRIMKAGFYLAAFVVTESYPAVYDLSTAEITNANGICKTSRLKENTQDRKGQIHIDLCILPKARPGKEPNASHCREVFPCYEESGPFCSSVGKASTGLKDSTYGRVAGSPGDLRTASNVHLYGVGGARLRSRRDPRQICSEENIKCLL
jgi:hypothetical protein